MDMKKSYLASDFRGAAEDLFKYRDAVMKACPKGKFPAF